MLKATREAIKAVCSADPSLTPVLINAALAELEGKGATCIMPAPAEPCYTRAQVAALLKRDPKTISRYARQGKLIPIFGGVDGKRATGYTGASVKAMLAGLRSA